MNAYIPIKPEEITEDVLVDIYRIFCSVYELEFDNFEARQLRAIGLRDLRGQFGLDSRPCMGAKFFGRRTQTGTEFYGYGLPKIQNRG